MVNEPSSEVQPPLHVPSDPAIPLSVKPLGFSSTQASVFLDVVRAVAALAVMLEHWRNLFFVDYPQVPQYRLLWAAPYVLTSAGHQSVIIFFVLSGYLISGSVFRMFAANTWSWRSYLLQRGVRLWIVLLPGLLLAALWDDIGLHLHRAYAVSMYAGRELSPMVPDIGPTFHLTTWLGNLFFLQKVYVPVFGSDSPLWSLTNEFWYYLLFPLGLLALRPSTVAWLRIVCVVVFFAIFSQLGFGIDCFFPIWLLGTLLYVLPAPRLGMAWRVGATAIYVPIFFSFAKVVTSIHILGDELFGLLTFGFLYVLLSARGPAPEQRRSTHAWRTLARFSFTLYIVHMPLLTLIAALTVTESRWVPNLPHVAMAGSFAVLTIAFAYALATVTEFRTDRARRSIDGFLPG